MDLDIGVVPEVNLPKKFKIHDTINRAQYFLGRKKTKEEITLRLFI